MSADVADTNKIKVSATRSLSSKLLGLTILFVLFAEILMFVPSVANFRIEWLKERLNTAGAASVLISTETSADLSRAAQDEVLMATGAKAIALRTGGIARLVVVAQMPPQVDEMINVDSFSPIDAIVDAFDTMIFGGDKALRVVGKIGDSEQIIEMVLKDDKLREAMLIYARNVALISLLISVLTALLVFLAINRIMIKPARAITRSMLKFAANPSAPDAITQFKDSNDEMGIAARELTSMQRQMQNTLRSQKRLADLGLAVSKINHDMRNILASAQLMSDMLADSDDPAVKRFGPKLVRTLDRAVNYTNDVLSYGKAQEQMPERRRIALSSVIEDVRDHLGVAADEGLEFSSAVDSAFEVDADPEQLFRVLHNLCRNAVQAMRDDQMPSSIKRLDISAMKDGANIIIHVEDTGPGLPQKALDNLFSAFKGSARHNGTGLGLAIAHELITAHGGSIKLREGRTVGTHFEIHLPQILGDKLAAKETMTRLNPSEN
ncbi:HAMP domain-containing sensor histidine kinase [Ahrensia kielensis]|uniref:histidine kinase n=1 Tax=Ahrensia kielensis TaxID=76980 RepID=A0ABU9T9X2_9HYPH